MSKMSTIVQMISLPIRKIKMASILIDIEIPSKSHKSIIQDPLLKDFRIGEIQINSGDKRYIFLTELMEGETAKFLPWKQSLTAMNLLVGQLLKKGTKYKLTFLNNGPKPEKLSIKISGNYVS